MAIAGEMQAKHTITVYYVDAYFGLFVGKQVDTFGERQLE
jgi:hypothetical protein